MPDQHGHVFGPFAQRRQVDPHHVEPVVKILAELPILDELFHVLVRGRDQANVDLDGLGSADAFDLPLLKHAEQLDLHGHGHVADFVEEQGALVGEFESPDALLVGSGERAFFVAEEFAFQEVLVERSAIHGHERAAPIRNRGLVNRAGHLLLAGASLAANEHGRGGVGNVADEFEDVVHLLAAAEDVLKRVPVAECLPEGRDFILQGAIA